MFQYRTIFLLIFAESRMILSESAPAGAGVTERTTSLHSGSSDSVKNPEAELRDFEARKRELKLAH